MAQKDFFIEESTINESDIIYHEQIGHGSECDVFRITWSSKDGDIEAAAKKIKIPFDPSHIQQLQFEIKLAKTLNHDNLIKYYGHIITESHVIIITEYASKGSLFGYLKKLRKNGGSRLPSAQIHLWASQAAKGIQYLRKADIVHRDVKSPNFLIMADDTLKLCDFGLSKYLPNTKTTYIGKGTFQWLAPEVWKDLKISPKADVFAFGIVLWELLTGEEPFAGMRAEHVLFSVAYGCVRPDIPKRCPDVYRALMLECWEDDREKRPTIDEVVDRLDGPIDVFGLPPGPVSTLRTSSSSTQIKVSWTLPDIPGDSSDIGYLVEYKTTDSESKWVNLKADLVTETSCIISGLKPGCRYQVRVCAVNKGGRGPEGGSDIVTTVASSRVYLHIAGVFAVIMAYGIYQLSTGEDFSATHSWILQHQFAHVKSMESAFVEGAQSVTINPTNDDIIVADWYSTNVNIYNSSGNLVGNLDASKGLQTSKSSHPRDVAVSANGTFFVTQQCPHVKVFNSSGHFVRDLQSSHIAAENARLSGIAFTKDGRLLLGECRFKSISIHLQDGTRLNTFNIEITPRYLAVTPNNSIVVSSWEPMAVQIMTLTGDVLFSLSPPKGVTQWRPTGVSCSDQFIFVANDDPSLNKDPSIRHEHGVYCYSFSGKFLGHATKDVFNPSGVAVNITGSKLLVAHWERGNPFEGRGFHGVKVFAKKLPAKPKT